MASCPIDRIDQIDFEREVESPLIIALAVLEDTNSKERREFNGSFKKEMKKCTCNVECGCDSKCHHCFCDDKSSPPPCDCTEFAKSHTKCDYHGICDCDYYGTGY